MHLVFFITSSGSSTALHTASELQKRHETSIYNRCEKHTEAEVIPEKFSPEKAYINTYQCCQRVSVSRVFSEGTKTAGRPGSVVGTFILPPPSIIHNEKYIIKNTGINENKKIFTNGICTITSTKLYTRSLY